MLVNQIIVLNKVLNFTEKRDDFHNNLFKFKKKKKKQDLKLKGAQASRKRKQRKKWNSSDATSVQLVRSDDLQSHLQSKLLSFQLRRRQVQDFQAFHFESHRCRSVCETLNKLQSGCLVLEQVFTKAGRLNMQSMSASAYHSNILYLLFRPLSHRITNTFGKGQRKAMEIVHFF